MEFDFNSCDPRMDGEWLLKYVGEQIGSSEVFYNKIERYSNKNVIFEGKVIRFLK